MVGWFRSRDECNEILRYERIMEYRDRFQVAPHQQLNATQQSERKEKGDWTEDAGIAAVGKLRLRREM